MLLNLVVLQLFQECAVLTRASLPTGMRKAPDCAEGPPGRIHDRTRIDSLLQFIRTGYAEPLFQQLAAAHKRVYADTTVRGRAHEPACM